MSRASEAKTVRPPGWSARQALLCCALGVAAIGQARADPVPSGTWRARFASESAEQEQATLVIDAAQASWTVLAQDGQAARDRCTGRPFPVTLFDSGSSTVSLSVAATAVDPQCRDLKARLTVVDANTLEGEFEDGRIVRLERVTARR